MDKCYVEIKVRVIINKDDDIALENVVNELDYHFEDTTRQADVVDQEIIDYDVTDAK